MWANKIAQDIIVKVVSGAIALIILKTTTIKVGLKND